MESSDPLHTVPEEGGVVVRRPPTPHIRVRLLNGSGDVTEGLVRSEDGSRRTRLTPQTMAHSDARLATRGA